MHPLITDIQLFGEPVRPVVHDTVYIHILRDAVVVGLFDADFGSGEAVDGLPLGDVAQIFQLFAGNIQFFELAAVLAAVKPEFCSMRSRVLPKSNAPIESIEKPSKRPLTLLSTLWPKE